MARLRTTTATSAGGIVIRRSGGTHEVVLGKRRRERDSASWTLPKGTPVPAETLEQTAVREVAEETGLEVRILEPLDRIEYTFVQSGVRIHKTVHYFLMEAVGGSLALHDHEFEEVRWVPTGDAGQMLTFETERSLVERALARLPGARLAQA